MPRIMGIGKISKLSKKHKPKKAGAFKGLGVVLEGSALKSKRYGGVGAAKKRGQEPAEMTAVLGPRVKRRRALIQIGPGKPGQRFRYENTDIETTLHPMKLKGLRGTPAEHATAGDHHIEKAMKGVLRGESNSYGGRSCKKRVSVAVFVIEHVAAAEQEFAWTKSNSHRRALLNDLRNRAGALLRSCVNAKSK